MTPYDAAALPNRLVGGTATPAYLSLMQVRKNWTIALPLRCNESALSITEFRQ